jgi:hypothetical protein
MLNGRYKQMFFSSILKSLATQSIYTQVVVLVPVVLTYAIQAPQTPPIPATKGSRPAFPFRWASENCNSSQNLCKEEQCKRESAPLKYCSKLEERYFSDAFTKKT